jgi:hypothetical protein
VAIAFILGLIKTSVAKAGVPARRPKETKVSLTKGFDLCSTFCFLEARRWLNFAIWAALRAPNGEKSFRARNDFSHLSNSRIREFQREDLQQPALILASPKVMKFSPTGVASVAQTQARIESFIASYQEFGFGKWAVILKMCARLT